MKRHILLLLSSVLLCSAVLAESPAPNKIIYLVSTPRSLSTAFVRMMKARGDCEVFSEPSQRAFHLVRYPKGVDNWFTKEGAATFKEVQERLNETLAQNHVFAKEMSFAVVDFLKEDHDFIKNEDVHFVFLVRNPHPVMVSLYLKYVELDENCTLQNKSTLEEFEDTAGFPSLYEALNLIKAISPNPVTVLLTEDLCNNPYEAVQSLCERLEIPFLEASLHWEGGESGFADGRKWHELKNPEQAKHWHGDAINSTGFGRPRSYTVDAVGQPLFSEAKSPEDQALLQEIYARSNAHYQAFLNEIPEGALIVTH